MLKVSSSVNIAQRLKILLIRPKASEEVGRGESRGELQEERKKALIEGQIRNRGFGNTDTVVGSPGIVS